MIDINKPDGVFTPWGWSKDIVDILFPRQMNNDKQRFQKYIDEVEKYIHYQCVVMISYGDRLVFIDCCDSNEWVLKDSFLGNNDLERTTYLKLQFNPNFKYPYRVHPFTYVTQNPITFQNALPEYRNRYDSTPKGNKAYGRFIAVSLDRFHIAHQFAKNGIKGGSYCISKEGYNDHFLDPESPRNRIPFAAYINNMIESRSVVDACGFGDLTHRMIECFAIGIPYIRPLLINNLFNPVDANMYIQCDRRGTDLKKCLSLVEDEEYCKDMTRRCRLWYDNNSSPEAIRNLYKKIVEGNNQ